MKIAFYISKDEEIFGYMIAHSSWKEQDDITIHERECYIYAIAEKYEILMHLYIAPFFNASRKVNRGKAKWIKTPADIFCECVDKYLNAVDKLKNR